MGKFDSNPTGEGASSGIKTAKIGHGQSLKSAYPLDNQSGYPLPDTHGGKMGGSATNLGHSLKGASAVQAPYVGAKDII
jgi:hypothetical protein